jgi:hypothetical protein
MVKARQASYHLLCAEPLQGLEVKVPEALVPLPCPVVSTSSKAARWCLRGDRRMPEETLRDCHLGYQSGAHDTLLLQGKGRGALAFARSCHNRLDGGQAMAVTSADEAGGEAVTSAQVVVALAGKPGGEPRRGWAARVVSERAPRPAM